MEIRKTQVFIIWGFLYFSTYHDCTLHVTQISTFRRLANAIFFLNVLYQLYFRGGFHPEFVINL